MLVSRAESAAQTEEMTAYARRSARVLTGVRLSPVGLTVPKISQAKTLRQAQNDGQERCRMYTENVVRENPLNWWPPGESQGGQSAKIRSFTPFSREYLQIRTARTSPGSICTFPDSFRTVPGPFYTLPPSICTLPRAIYTVPGSICALPGSICTSPASIYTSPGLICVLPGAICTLPGPIDRVPGSICTFPPGIYASFSALKLAEGFGEVSAQNDARRALRHFTRLASPQSCSRA
jgi:hypothetical protein